MTRRPGGFRSVLADTAPRAVFRLIPPRNFLSGKRLSHHWTGGPRGCPFLQDEILLRRRVAFGTAIAVEKKCFSHLNWRGFGVSR
jgi:hypothetical protein